MIRLVGPGGAGKSTVGALLAERLNVAFLDLDRRFVDHFGDIGAYINRQGYESYARANVEQYCALIRAETSAGVLALSSGFMTYGSDVHPEYPKARHEIAMSPITFVLLPSLDRELCVAETVRRQLGRPFARSASREEAVIRARFDIYMALPARKIATMLVIDAVDEILAACANFPAP